MARPGSLVVDGILKDHRPSHRAFMDANYTAGVPVIGLHSCLFWLRPVQTQNTVGGRDSDLASGQDDVICRPNKT